MEYYSRIHGNAMDLESTEHSTPDDVGTTEVVPFHKALAGEGARATQMHEVFMILHESCLSS